MLHFVLHDVHKTLYRQYSHDVTVYLGVILPMVRRSISSTICQALSLSLLPNHNESKQNQHHSVSVGDNHCATMHGSGLMNGSRIFTGAS